MNVSAAPGANAAGGLASPSPGGGSPADIHPELFARLLRRLQRRSRGWSWGVFSFEDAEASCREMAERRGVPWPAREVIEARVQAWIDGRPAEERIAIRRLMRAASERN